MAVRKLRYIEKGDIGTGRYSRLVASVASDTDVCALDPKQDGNAARAFYVLGAGNLSYQSPGDRNNSGTEQTVSAVPFAAGTRVDCMVSRLVASGTTATNILLIW